MVGRYKNIIMSYMIGILLVSCSCVVHLTSICLNGSDIVANFSSSSGDDLPLSADRNMLILLRPDYSFVEERRIAPPGAVETDEKVRRRDMQGQLDDSTF